MGNGIGTLAICFSGHTPRRHSGRRHISRMVPEQFDEGLGHSFCYVRPDPSKFSSSKVHSEEATIPAMTTTTFRSISGASVSANTSTPLSTSLSEFCNSFERASAAFESSTSFSSVPLQPVPVSGPIERGFLSGPIERAFMSGPLLCSGPIGSENDQFQRSFSHGAYRLKPRSRKRSVIRVLRKVISKTIARSAVAPVKGPVLVKDLDWVCEKNAADNNLTISSANLSSELSLEDDESLSSQNLEWAQGKAGEDRVHVVISEEHGWVFVGIYDGFNGPDAPDFLLSNLYSYVHKELKGLLWEDKLESVKDSELERISTQTHQPDCSVSKSSIDDSCSQSVETENYPFESKKNLNPNPDSKRTRTRKSKNKYKSAAKKWEENQRRWKLEWERERLELERRLKEQLSRSSSHQSVNRSDVLKALSQALRKTEEAYFDIADNMLSENPELALMGSCVLVMLMKGEDVYLMNVGDSRAVLAQKAEPDVWGSLGKDHQDLERIKEETLHDLEVSDGDQTERLPSLSALQLSVDHSTSVEEEVQRIKNEHPDDAFALANDRVKGSLKVTRAFGAGFLKQPKWNSALLEAFQIDYVGASPYINCIPSLYHHRLGSKDKFLILSSDGLYQYFTIEEAVAEVELFIDSSPDGDPAQHLVEVVLFRAAEKAGMDFHELLEIPQGDRRRYHDDVSIIVISLEGRIWRSCM